MIRIAEKNPEKALAPDINGVVEFRKYTQRVWSKAAGRPISEEEADRIIEDFGQFLQALANEK